MVRVSKGSSDRPRTTRETKSDSKKRDDKKITKQKKVKKPTGGKIKCDGGITKIGMSQNDEERVLKLITMLDSGELEINLAAAVSSIPDDSSDESDDDGGSCSGDESDNDSEDSDSDDDSEDSDDNEDFHFDRDVSNKKKAPTKFSTSDTNAIISKVDFTEKQRRSLIRKLIRDDRKLSYLLACKASDEKLSRNLLAKAIMTSEKKIAGQNDSKKGDLILTNKNKMPRQYVEIPQDLSATIRLNLSCASKAGSIAVSGPTKVVLFDRVESLERLVEITRNKFAATKKFSELLILPEGQLLTADELFNLPDGSHLLLSIGQRTETPSKVKPLTELLNQKNGIPMSSVDKGKEDKAVLPTESAPSEDDYWAPPDKFVSLEALTTPRVVGDEKLCKQLMEDQEARFSNQSYAKILTQRKSLPIFEVREKLLSTIRDNQFIVVSGETGSGKTTQLPAYLLEDMISSGRGGEAYIICTQPRRIAAITVSERVAFERQEAIGKTIGYQVRLNSRCGPSTRILYCTTGVLLRRLQNPDFLSSVSHIVVDEVHERQVETDFLMTLLKQNAPQHPHLRLVMMSATVQEGLFTDYFSCPVVYVKGRCYEVKNHFIGEIHKLIAFQQREVAAERGKGPNEKVPRGRQEGRGNQKDSAIAPVIEKPPRFDAENVAETIIRIIQTHSTRNRKDIFTSPVASINESGTGDGILVFLSGLEAINKVNRALRQRNMQSLNAQVHMLHSSLTPEVQKRVFTKTKPGEWKIVLSTNIAETSVTVDDVTHVIDCGLVKELRYDAVANMSSLEEVFVSRASAKQRAGRAGRVRPGHCWRMYSSEFLLSSFVEDNSAPEIKRVPLEEVVLQVLLLKLGLPEHFLGQCLEPPAMSQIKSSVNCLLDIKAILPRATLPLTALGYHLAQMPVDVKIGKMLITASLLNCIEPALTVAAAIGGKSPFTSHPLKRAESAKAHSTFTSSYNFSLAADKYSISFSNNTSEDRDRDSRHRDYLTPPNDVFFSDHLACVNAYNLWEKIFHSQGNAIAYDYCREYYLSYNALNDIMKLRQNFKKHLQTSGFIPGGQEDLDVENINDTDYDMEPNSKVENLTMDFLSLSTTAGTGYGTMRCALCAGLYPQVVRVSRFEDQEVKAAKKSRSTAGRPRELAPLRIMQGDGVEVHVHPSSLTHEYVKYLLEGGQGSGQGMSQPQKIKDAYIVYHKKILSSKVFLHDCTSVPIAAILLFGGDVLISRTRKGVSCDAYVMVTVGSWIHFKMKELHAVLFRRLQQEMDALLRIKVENPANDVSKRQAVLVRVVQALLE